MQTAENTKTIEYDYENMDLKALEERMKRFIELSKGLRKKADEIKNGGTKA